MPIPTERITRERLAGWAKRLEQSHATPIALFAAGHDHNKGLLVVCTLDEPELDRAALCGLLRSALQQIESQIAEEN